MWKRHFRYATDGTYDAILRAVAQAGLIPEGAAESIEEFLAADSTIVRAHQHAAGARTDSTGAQATGHTGGGEGLTYKVPPIEPADHTLGRESRRRSML
ncbi:hypothetical protein GCM10010974_33620 [Brevibacterium sediminis]|uniref:Transposase n=1 Tax=Brevibacterium sediminis TaxID=1857024 RepID=A0ABQ1MYH2_9MICO|nr:hypothetical protein GCM10010974_33620 [Brevibacterium sediminis]